MIVFGKDREIHSLDGDSIWYCAISVGQKTLSGFMTNISKSLNLPKYTNHCIRATGATLLSRSGYNNAQIMAITGHKSVSSLAIYQQVNDQEKMNMGDTLTKFVDRSSSSAVPLPVAHVNNIIATASKSPNPGIISHSNSSIVPSLPVSSSATTTIAPSPYADFLSTMRLEDFDVFVNENSHVVRKNPIHLQQFPTFSNCVISHLTINYNRTADE